MIKCLKDIREKRDKRPVEESEDHYGRHDAAVMKRLPNQAKAVVCLKIEQLLINAEFPKNEHTPYIIPSVNSDKFCINVSMREQWSFEN